MMSCVCSTHHMPGSGEKAQAGLWEFIFQLHTDLHPRGTYGLDLGTLCLDLQDHLTTL